MATDNKKKAALKLYVGNVAMHDAGHKVGEIKLQKPQALTEQKIYPSLHVSTTDVPSLQGKQAGDYVTLVIRACVRSVTSNQTKGNDKKESFSLDLEKIGAVNPEGLPKEKGGKENY